MQNGGRCWDHAAQIGSVLAAALPAEVRSATLASIYRAVAAVNADDASPRSGDGSAAPVLPSA